MIIFVALGCAACRLLTLPPAYQAYHAIEVPFIAQRDSIDCGPMTLAMLIRHYHGDPDFDRLHDALVIPALGGTTPALMVAVATEKGYHAHVSNNNPDFVMTALEAAAPPIVLLGPSEVSGAGHYVVVTGLTEKGDAIRMHDGRIKNRWMEFDKFIERWQKSGYLAITISPAGATE